MPIGGPNPTPIDSLRDEDYLRLKILTCMLPTL